MPVLNGRGRGDLYVEVKVQTPSKLSKRQRELLEELRGTTSVENKPVSRSLLNKVKEIFSSSWRVSFQLLATDRFAG